MGSGDQLNTVDMTEVVSDFWAKYPSCSSGVDSPVFNVLRVGPHEVAEGAFVWDFDLPVDGSDLVNSLDLGAEASVDTEGFSVNNGSNWQVVKDFCAVFPWIGVSILSVDFIVKAINGSYLSGLGKKIPGLVVSSQEGNSVGILDFKAEEILKSFDWVIASINKISDEDVACLIDLSALEWVKKYRFWRVRARHRIVRGRHHRRWQDWRRVEHWTIPGGFIWPIRIQF